MNTPLSYMLALLLGFCIGLIYFGGLWLTIKSISLRKFPSLLSMFSFFGRFAVAAAGFYITARFGGLAHILIALSGVMICKMILVRTLSFSEDTHGN
jgi:F1F0 ATPase subunit 2